MLREMNIKALGERPSERFNAFASSTVFARQISVAKVRIWMWLLLVGFNLQPSVTWAQSMVLVGSGSTVPAPLYNQWAADYGKHNPKIQVRYVPIGTEEGINQISKGSGDFAAGEALLTDDQRDKDGLIELPQMLIAVVPIYSLPGMRQELRFSGEVLAEIFLGAVKTWDAPQIAKLNPGVSLPHTAIRVIHRPAGKGSNYVFTDFLSKTSPKFRAQIGVSTSPEWPVGESAERSSDMVDKVKSTAGSIGYVEYHYQMTGNIPQAAVLNAAGKFVKASPPGLISACQVLESPRWHNLSASLVNAGGDNSYPITSFTWIYLRSKNLDPLRAAALDNWLEWSYSDGQAHAEADGYTALPRQLLAEIRKKLKELHN